MVYIAMNSVQKDGSIYSVILISISENIHAEFRYGLWN